MCSCIRHISYLCCYLLGEETLIRLRLEEGMRTLYGHAQSVEGDANITVLRAKRTLDDSEARAGLWCSIYSSDLKKKKEKKKRLKILGL